MDKKRVRNLLYVVTLVLLASILLISTSILRESRLRMDDLAPTHSLKDEATAQEGHFLQTMLDALNSPNQVEAAYESLSASRKGGASYELFVEYLSLLRLQYPGNIESLSALTRAEKRQYEKHLQVTTRHSHDAESAYYYLESKGVDAEERLAIRFLEDHGKLTLDAPYMQATLDLMQHANLYLTALRDQNLESLTKLIMSDSPQTEIKVLKATRTLEYYEQEGVELAQRPKITYLSPDYLELSLYKAPTRQGSGLDRSDTSHRVAFIRKRDVIQTMDLIPMKTLTQVRYISLSKPIIVGSVAPISRFDVQDLNQLELCLEIFGKPGSKTIKLDYESLVLTSPGGEPVTVYLRSVDQDHMRAVYAYPSKIARAEDRRGHLIYLSLEEGSETWQIGGDLALGMSRDDLLMAYPFFDVFGYRAGLTSRLGLKLDFNTNDELKQLVYLLPEWLEVQPKLSTLPATSAQE